MGAWCGEGAIDVGVLLAVAGEDRDRLGSLAEGRDGRDEDLLFAGCVDVGAPMGGRMGRRR